MHWYLLAIGFVACLAPVSACPIPAPPIDFDSDILFPDTPPEVVTAMVWAPRFGGIDFNRSGLLFPGAASRSRLPLSVLGRMLGLDDGKPQSEAFIDLVLEGRSVLELAGFRINRAQALVSASASGAAARRMTEPVTCLLLGAAAFAVQYRRRRPAG